MRGKQTFIFHNSKGSTIWLSLRKLVSATEKQTVELLHLSNSNVITQKLTQNQEKKLKFWVIKLNFWDNNPKWWLLVAKKCYFQWKKQASMWCFSSKLKVGWPVLSLPHLSPISQSALLIHTQPSSLSPPARSTFLPLFVLVAVQQLFVIFWFCCFFYSCMTFKAVCF